MENLTYEVKDNVLTIQVDLTGKTAPSASGKSAVIASTHGNIALGNGVSLGLNVYRRVQ